jgi:endonuclease/exonuclease/phosphatase family metal-dependent hydrolase
VKLFRWLNILWVLATLPVYLASFIAPSSIFWPIAILGPALPWLLLGHLLFILFWAGLRKPYVFLSILCVLGGWNQVSRLIGFHGNGSSSETSFQVMSYNVYQLRGIEAEEPFWDFMKKMGPPDILCTQESSAKVVARLAEKLDYDHIHHYSGRGTAVLSRFPILERGKIPFEQSTNSCVWADLNVYGKRIRVYSIHLQSNHITREAQELAASGDWQDQETWKGVRGILAKYRWAAVQRSKQAQVISDHITASPYPVILTGDLNDTPQSYAYRRLRAAADLKDGFQERGLGTGFTFGGVIPALRIDYILHDPRLETIDYRSPRRRFSDHFPVVAEISLP